MSVSRARFRYGHAAHSDGAHAVESCLAQIAAQTSAQGFGPGANLGFIYLSDGLRPQAERVLALLKSKTGIPNWVGTSGVGVCGGAVEYFDEPALAIMLGRFPAGSFNVFSGTQRPPAAGMRTPSGADAAYTALVHADPESADLQGLLVDMAGKVSSGCLFGGLSSARANEGHFVQIADRVLRGGLSGVVFGADVGLVSRVTQGCYPLNGAAPRRVTRAENHLILELDGRDAFGALLEDAGIRVQVAAPEGTDGGRELRARLQALGRRGLFVGIDPRGDGDLPSPGPGIDYLVRQVVALDAGRGAVAVAETVAENQMIRFCTRDETAARRDLVRLCSEIREHLDEQGRSGRAESGARGAIYVSCLGRGSNMFGEPGEEARLIQNQLGDIPLVGFSAAGEIGGSRLYGFTGVLTVFY